MRKAFTLIEVMVVLSILAIIAILAYNFFGSTMREATLKSGATQLYKEINMMLDSVERYQIDHGDYPNTNSTLATMATEGYVRDGVATANNPIRDTGWPLIPISFNKYGGNKWGGASNDAWVEMGYITADGCSTFNDLYTNLGPDNTQGYIAAYTAGNSVFCWKSGSLYIINAIVDVQ